MRAARPRPSILSRRAGSHAKPSPAQKAAAYAAPAIAAAAVAAVPQHAPAPAAGAPAHGTGAPVVVATAIVRPAAVKEAGEYQVQPGDTLSGIALQTYGDAGQWRQVYAVNASVVTDPDLIYPGQMLVLPRDGETPVTPYQPRHAASVRHDTSASQDESAQQPAPAQHPSSLGGTLGCSGLKQLWESAGGSPSAALTAASVAMAESGGDQYAHSPSDDYGYWQINGSNGALATYDAYGNARAAIILSHDGTDWSAWTTFTSGAYAGRC